MACYPPLSSPGCAQGCLWLWNCSEKIFWSCRLSLRTSHEGSLSQLLSPSVDSGSSEQLEIGPQVTQSSLLVQLDSLIWFS